MGAHNANHGGQAQSPSGEFGGEEGVENLGLGFGTHTASRIPNLQVHVGAGRQVVVEVGGGEAGEIGIQHAGGDPDDAAVIADGFGGVGDQIHDDLADLGGIGFDRRQRGGEGELDGGFFGKDSPQQVGGFLRHAREVYGLQGKAALARIGQHLIGELGGAAGGGFDFGQVFDGGRCRGQIQQGNARIAQNDGEEVVEIVGQAAG